jgi:cytochrome c553
VEAQPTGQTQCYGHLLGVKGLGEIGIVGVATAVANAAFYVTGKRVQDLLSPPISQPDHRQRKPWLLLVIIIFCGGTTRAAAPFSAAETGSGPRGHLIAVGGGPGGAGTACFSCHGLQGQGDAGGAFPRLVGLDAHYLAKQLDDYASRGRSDPVMTPISQQLSPGEVMAVVQTAMLAGTPYTGLRDAMFTHPTMAEGLGALFTNVSPQAVRSRAQA